jgi:hypothetical protein
VSDRTRAAPGSQPSVDRLKAEIERRRHLNRTCWMTCRGLRERATARPNRGAGSSASIAAAARTVGSRSHLGIEPVALKAARDPRRLARDLCRRRSLRNSAMISIPDMKKRYFFTLLLSV